MIKKIIDKFQKLSKEYGTKKAIQKILLSGVRLPYKYLKKINLYLRQKLKVPYRLNMDQVEIELTTVCNLHCLNCDRSTGQAPSGEYMTVEQIKKFIRESIELNKKWKLLRVMGGEPTLHPNIIEICNLFLEYKKNHSLKTEIMLFTNGYGQRVTDTLNTIPKGIYIRNSGKESPTQFFSSYNIAPVDLKDFHEKNKKNYYKGCQVNEMCGLGLSRYGYYVCGAGASVDRVFGWDIGIKKLSLVKKAILRKQLSLLCRYCGHFKNWGRTFPKGGPILVDKEAMSESWVKAYKAYKEKKPDNSLY